MTSHQQSQQAEILAAVKADQSGQAYGTTAKVLKDAIEKTHIASFEKHARGDKIARALSDGMDKILIALFDASFRSKPEMREHMVMCAVGGYGAARLAPYSDIDLLFLYDPDYETQFKENLETLLYPLWDSGLKIGYGAHTPKSAIHFCKTDMIGRTAYLDARMLCGGQSVFDDFRAQYERLRKSTASEFVQAKLDEQAARQTAAFETRYLVEPDIKDGKSGLRDLQTIRWLYKYVYGGVIGSTRQSIKSWTRRSAVRWPRLSSFYGPCVFIFMTSVAVPMST